MKRFLILLMTLGLVIGSVATAEAEQRFERAERTVEASYYGAQLLYQYRSCPLSGGAGCVTIETLAGEESLTARATDAHHRPVSVWVVDASERQDELDGANRVYGRFCGYTTEPIRFDPGTKLELWVGGEWWPTWWIIPELPPCFPGAATTGTIQVTFSGGWTPSDGPASPSLEPGGSPAPQPSPSGRPAVVERSVDLRLRRHLRSEGAVASQDPLCRSEVRVVVQRKKSADWIEVGSVTTDSDGAFALRLRDRAGRYRAIAPEVSSSEKTCLAAISTMARHRH